MKKRVSLRRMKARAKAGKLISGRAWAVYGLWRWFRPVRTDLNIDASYAVPIKKGDP